jgi:hypothetical protein
LTDQFGAAVSGPFVWRPRRETRDRPSHRGLVGAVRGITGFQKTP